jgi:hypothetical protein
LIEIFQKGENYERFAEKSRIEEIVEGKTAQIHWDLYKRIVDRSKDMMEKEGKRPEGVLTARTNKLGLEVY